MRVEQLKLLITALGTILAPVAIAWAGNTYAQATQQSGMSAVGDQVEEVPQVPATPDESNPGIGGSGTYDPSQGADGTALPSATKTTVSATDLVGRWKYGADSELNYVTGSGAYAGNQSVLYTTIYDLHADMTYDRQTDGISSTTGQVHDKRSGTWRLSESKIIFSPNSGEQEEGYWLLSFEDKPNGSVLTVLADRWPLEEGSFSYKEEWSRLKE